MNGFSLLAQQQKSDATGQWILTTISNTGEGVAVIKTLLIVDITLHSVFLFFLILFAFWIKKKFRESGEDYRATKLAYLATQVEKDLTKADNTRAVQRVLERAEEMKVHGEQTLTAIKETVAAAVSPTVVVVEPAVAVAQPRKPGDPERRDPSRPDPALSPVPKEAAR